MKKYMSVSGMTRMVFKNKEDALNHVNEKTGYEYKESSEWSYRTQLSGTVTLKGENIKEAIETSFKKIAEDVGLYGASGYSLNSVVLKDNRDGTATLNIEGWPFSKALVGFEQSMLSKETMKDIKLEITNVEDGEIPNGEIVFEIK